MKRTKQAAAVFTALALAATMAVPVWATENESGTTLIDNDTANKEATCDVTGTYNVQTVYHVDIEWSKMNFTYTPGTWIPENGSENLLQYKGDNVGWNNNGADGNPSHYVKITNKSNVNVNIDLSYANEDTLNDNRVEADFIVLREVGGHTEYYKTVKSIWMERADANVVGTVQSTGGTTDGTTKKYNAQGTVSEALLYISLSGRPAKAINNEKVGTLTLTVGDGGDTAPDETTTTEIYKQKTDSLT